MNLKVIAASASFAFAALFGECAIGQATGYLPDVEYGQGSFDQTQFDMRRAMASRPISDGFRFTINPASGLRKGYVFEGRQNRDGATLVVTWMERNSHLTWRPVRRRTFRLSTEEYSGLTASLDDNLNRARAYAARIEAGEETTWLCTDGAYLVTERFSPDGGRWMAGDCGLNHPNNAVEALLRDFILDRLGD